MRVAYDISVLGSYFHRFDSKSGIFRVIEEVMYEILKSEEADLTAIGLCGDDLLSASLCSFFYTESLQEKIPYETTFSSRLSLFNFYKNVFDVYFSKEFQKLPKCSMLSLKIRGSIKALHWLQKLDVYPSFDSNSFDIFHSPYLKLPPKEVLGNLPRILTVYDLIPVTAPEFVVSDLTKLFRGILKSIDIERDWIAAISEYTKDEFCSYTGMPYNRVFVTHLAAANHFYPVDDTKIIESIKQKYKIPEKSYFLSLAALQPRKNLLHLIKCFFRLLEEQPNIDLNLVLVGSKGWMYEEIFAAASSSAKFRSRVIFTGYVPDKDLSAIYSGATSFIYPSLYEGFGLPPLEAMQCGVPVITSNTTSLPEVVGDAGIMVNPKDEDTLCQAMLNISTDSTLRQQLSHKGLKRANQFSWKKCAAQTIEIYRKAIVK